VVAGLRPARATVTVDLAAIAANTRLLREAARPAELWAVVKADGYGHGAAAVGRAAFDAGASRLCVATLDEAHALLRDLPDAPLLVMSPLVAGEEDLAVEIDVAVSSVEGFTRLRSAARLPVGVHIKADTGMGRWGMDEDEALRIGAELADSTGPLRLAGLMSHFASSESDADFTARQLERFERLSEQFPPCPRHIANSAATLGVPGARFDAVRCGIAMYGLSPYGGDPAEHGLTPALRFETAVAQVKRLGQGESTGYGRRFVAERPVWIGLAPAGYADGVPRMMSGEMEVLVGGRRRRVVATISMDQLTFLIGDACDVRPGDPVVLIGEQADEAIRAEEWARLCETINYEIVCDIAPRRRRVEHVILDA